MADEEFIGKSHFQKYNTTKKSNSDRSLNISELDYSKLAKIKKEKKELVQHIIYRYKLIIEIIDGKKNYHYFDPKADKGWIKISMDKFLDEMDEFPYNFFEETEDQTIFEREEYE